MMVSGVRSSCAALAVNRRWMRKHSSPAIRFAERAERCQGTEMLAQLSGLPLALTPEHAEG